MTQHTTSLSKMALGFAILAIAFTATIVPTGIAPGGSVSDSGTIGVFCDPSIPGCFVSRENFQEFQVDP